jgi:hypothetical protein
VLPGAFLNVGNRLQSGQMAKFFDGVGTRGERFYR